MNERPLRISQVAATVGVSGDTIRYYERIGVLPKASRSNSGYRQYSESAIDRIRFVRNAVSLGFSLKQIAAFVRARDHGRAPCREVRAAAERILADVDRQIEQLSSARTAIQETLQMWDQRLAQTPPGSPARLLESLLPNYPATRFNLPLKRRRKS